MFRELIETITDFLIPAGDPEKQLAKDAWKRANQAYAAAWTTRGDEAALRAEMQSRNVPGSFVDGDPALRLYFDAWRTGTDPATVRAESRRALSAT